MSVGVMSAMNAREGMTHVVSAAYMKMQCWSKDCRESAAPGPGKDRSTKMKSILDRACAIGYD